MGETGIRHRQRRLGRWHQQWHPGGTIASLRYTSGSQEHTIARDRAGDIRVVEHTPESQFEAIYRLTYQKTLAYVRRRTSNLSDALDVVSDTYLVAWRRLDTLLAVDEPQAWLYGVASRTLSNLNRSQRRRESLLSRIVELESNQLGVDPAESVAWSDDLVAVLTAMDRLSEHDQELLLIAAYEDLSHTEIALALGTRPVLIRSALFRARRRLERQTRDVAQQRYEASGHTTTDRDNEERSR